MSEIDRIGILKIMKKAIARVSCGAGYAHVSFDLDALDPSLAPGVGTPVGGGLDYREAHLAMELISGGGVMTFMEVVCGEACAIRDRQEHSLNGQWRS